MSLSDLRSALDARNIFMSIAEEVVNRLRPEEKIGKVYSYDTNSQTAQILLAGETINSLITARFALDKVPFVQMQSLWASQGYSAPGDIVRITGKPGSYYISDFISGYPRSWGGVEIGTGMMWFGATVPNDRYLFCQGQTYSGNEYPLLAGVLGDTYGTHSGDTYYLPDLRSRSPIGVGGQLVPAQLYGGYSLGQKFGDERLHAHDHGGSTGSAVDSNQGYSAVPEAYYGLNFGLMAGGGQGYAGRPMVWNNTGGNTHAHTVATSGSGGAQNVHPVLGVNFIIKAR